MFDEDDVVYDLLSVQLEMIDINRHIEQYEDDVLVDNIVKLQTYFDFSKHTDKIISNFFSVGKLSIKDRKILEAGVALVINSISIDEKGGIDYTVLKKDF